MTVNDKGQEVLDPKFKTNSDGAKIIQNLVDIALKQWGVANLVYSDVLKIIEVDNEYFEDLQKKEEAQKKKLQKSSEAKK